MPKNNFSSRIKGENIVKFDQINLYKTTKGKGLNFARKMKLK